MFRRSALAIVALVAALTAAAGPATAGTATATITPPAGWFFQGSFPPGGFPFNDQCTNAAQAMMANGTAVTWQCLLISGQMKLYTLPGPWRYHSTYPPSNSHFGSLCSDAGQALLAAGAILTWRCILRNGTDFNLEVL
jgi:hypothetical protein